MAIFFHEGEESAGIKNKRLLKNWLIDLIHTENARTGQINIIFTSDEELLKLNRKYLSRDYLTDIITFDYSDNQLVAGDLYISIQQVKENAGIFGVSYGKELKRVLAHGILHLLGYDDSNDNERLIMREKEDLFLGSSPEI